MNRLMIERGADGHFADREGGISSGVRRLSILDVDGGHRPLANEDGSVCAVLNSEIAFVYAAGGERPVWLMTWPQAAAWSLPSEVAKSGA
jgi:hypothetical protein